jgi:hypothetical protein
MLALYATTIFICLASVAVGDTVLRICGCNGRELLAPAVGLSSLVVLATTGFWLPGGQITACVLVVLATAAAAAHLIRARVRPSIVALATALVALFAVSVPFAVNRHVGIVGVSIDDDFAAHFTWAASLYEYVPGAVVYPDYPLGPHSLAASLAGLFGTSVEAPFTAILLAAPVLTALTAQAVVKDARWWIRVGVGLVVGLPYLAAAHLVEGSFKELIMGLIVLAIALTIRQFELEQDWRPRRAVPLGIMTGAVLLIYGRTGLVWPLGGVALWVVASLIRTRSLPSASLIKRAASFVGLSVLVMLLASFSELSRIVSFSGGVPGGNIPNYTSPFQVLGVWFSGDFRFSPSDAFQTGLLIGLAIALAVYGVAWWLRRGDLAVLMTAVASLLIYAVVRDHTGPYLTSKAVVLAAPVTMLAIVVPVTSAWSTGMTLGRVVVGLAGVAFIAAAMWSSLFALRYGRVDSDEHENELSAIRRVVRDQPTLDLVPDAFALWDLRGAKLSTPTEYGGASVIPFALREPYKPGSSLDIDAVSPSSLDSFRYIVTTTSQYASGMPSNWQLIVTTRNFALWRRVGATPERSSLTGGTAPGSILNCATREGRELARSGGVADVWTTPPFGPNLGWELGATVVPSSPEGYIVVPTGSMLTQTLTLSRGRWEISLPYQSTADLYLSAGNLRAIIPSNLTNYGAYWRVGDITSTGAPIAVSLKLQQMRFDAAEQVEAIGGLVAVPIPRRTSVVPLQRACGRYVDWYRR